MRPPQNAGESRDTWPDYKRVVKASMRPPQNAGGSNRRVALHAVLAGASMRPPQNAGESFRYPFAAKRSHLALQ